MLDTYGGFSYNVLVDHSDRSPEELGCLTLLGQLPKWPNGTDCKSVARASEVRILHCPPKQGKVGPCGAAAAHSLGKTGVMGSIPITGSRGF